LDNSISSTQRRLKNFKKEVSNPIDDEEKRDTIPAGRRKKSSDFTILS